MSKKAMNNDFPIQIFADGPKLEEITSLDTNLVKGFTFNPTLFRNLGVSNYLDYCKKLVEICGEFPISLEVIADDEDSMIKQGLILGELGNNVFVKIPVTFTSGVSTLSVIKTLVEEKIKLNITAIFTIDQVKTILPTLKYTESIISIFSGRLFDVGINAVKITGNIAEFIHQNSNCKILWASPRMVYDIINACNANCDIITMQSPLLKKIPLFQKSPEEYSLDTVKMFYNDAVESKYIL